MKTKILTFIIISIMVLTMLPIPGTSAFADPLLPIDRLDAPQNVMVEVKEQEDGKPYFEVKWTNPQSIKDLYVIADESGEAPLGYQIDMKVGNEKWNYDISGDTIPGNSLHSGEIVNYAPYDPINAGELDSVDIKANVYYFRVRYSYLNSNDDEEYYVYSSFSNIASTGVEAFYKDASSWAVAELDKAVKYGFITDKIKNNMKTPVTREEFCEVVVRLYEKLTGKTAAYGSNPFTDTNNPEILKAYELGIVNGIGQGKFAPDNLITRQEISVMLYRAVKVCKPDADLSTSGVAKFKDEASISSWAIDSVRFMFKNGIIKGPGDGSIDPRGNTTREQAVLLAVRTYEKYLN